MLLRQPFQLLLQMKCRCHIFLIVFVLRFCRNTEMCHIVKKRFVLFYSIRAERHTVANSINLDIKVFDRNGGFGSENKIFVPATYCEP